MYVPIYGGNLEARLGFIAQW